MATADFSQLALAGVQSKSRIGFKLHNGDFIFFWDNTNYRKMVLTKNNGSVVQDGYMDLPAEGWRDTSVWMKGGGYTILNFGGYTGGIPDRVVYF